MTLDFLRAWLTEIAHARVKADDDPPAAAGGLGAGQGCPERAFGRVDGCEEPPVSPARAFYAPAPRPAPLIGESTSMEGKNDG